MASPLDASRRSPPRSPPSTGASTSQSSGEHGVVVVVDAVWAAGGIASCGDEPAHPIELAGWCVWKSSVPCAARVCRGCVVWDALRGPDQLQDSKSATRCSSVPQRVCAQLEAARHRLPWPITAASMPHDAFFLFSPDSVAKHNDLIVPSPAIGGRTWKSI